ncbi:Mobile element protein [hydrothermal vent metagenome]|uniref:Mobile element protein n=1 Tax=hydrothermal vent metagenome TaxID=652676 RepID=A0A1W1C2K1_9ZZZZ
MYSIGKFSQLIGKSVYTLRVWEKNGKLIPSYRTKGNQRMYSEEQLHEVLQIEKPKNRINLGYVRVSAQHQKDDLVRQKELMELYLAKQGSEFKIISDIGSGINYNKNGLKELLKMVSNNQVSKVFIVHKDRLIRFGFELIEEICKIHNTEIVVINSSEDKTDEQEMIEDIMNIIHVFSCRMNGKRSHINKKLIEKLGKS